jgi:hypothetical protein
MTRHAPGASHRLTALVVVALLGLGPVGARGQDATPAGTPSGAAVTVVAAGLTNPRGFTFGPDGTLFVALGGTPGPTAAVVAIRRGCPTVVAGGFPTGGVVFRTVTGFADVAFLGGRLYALLAGGANDLRGPHNGLYRLDGHGGATLVADISAFIRDHPVAARPRDYGAAGQPYALLPMGDGFWVTEGNSNQVLRLGLDGTVTRVADLSHGHPVPTGIAPSPAGGAYVGFFTHAPYAEGAATVVTVAPDGTVANSWTGLTLVTGLAVGPDGALYALELATGIDPQDPASLKPGTGKVVRRTGPTTAVDVVTGLTLPAAMHFGPDGALYVAAPAFGADAGQGTILRVDLAAGAPVAVPVAPVPHPTCP